MRVTVLNLARQLGQDAGALSVACKGADVILGCEAIRSNGSPLVVSELLPAGWEVYQDTDSPARAGSFVAWRLSTMEQRGEGEHVQASRASMPGEIPAVRPRFIAHIPLRERSTGDTRTYAAFHAPLRTTGRQEEFYGRLVIFAKNHPRAVLGGDCNRPHANVADLLVRLSVGAEVMGIFVPASLRVADTPDTTHPGSDHPMVRATLTAPTRKEPDVTQVRLTRLAAVLREAGLKVVEIDGWQTRSRPESAGSFNPVGVLWHHTGGPADGKEYAEWLAKVGRSDLPAPLCQLSVGRDGTWYVCAAGRANHAGQARASGTVAAGDGNALYVGVECMNTGTEGWTRAQYASMVKGGAALGKMLGCTPNAQRAHKETSVTGKWDPGNLDMGKFRTDIAVAMNPAPQSTRVSRTRSRLLAALDHDDAKSIPTSRRFVRTLLATIRATTLRLPKE